MLDHLDALAIRVGDRPAKLFLGNGPLGLEVVEVTLATVLETELIEGE